CSVTPSIALAAGTNYNWFVNASNAYGTSAWSGVRQISVAGTPTPTPTSGPPAAATHVSPIGTITTTNPVYVWNASGGATSYRLLVQNTNGVAVDLDVPATTAGCGAGTGTCSYNPNRVLTSNANWAWFLKASNASGSSAWSTGGQFRTP
ncbi:MAG: hypothetical protein H7Y14_07790, partial [Burkholderiales bacterium]|nr:hypothetical protein [Burkholderiales bacterium]